MTHQTDWLDGTKLVAWLEDKGILSCASIQVGREDESLIRAWRKGRAANFYVADRVLCKLGVCIGEIPDGFYRAAPENGGRHEPINAATKRRIAELYREHGNFRAVARIVGCGEKSVARYAREVTS